MLTPSIWRNNFFNDSVERIFDNMFDMPKMWENNRNLMSTDIKELGDTYQLSMELPGYEKENISADLQDGILTISAERKNETEEKDDNDKFVRRERYMGCLKRSFQVDKGLKTEDIRASFENGVLNLTIPKKEQQEIEENKTILIQ